MSNNGSLYALGLEYEAAAQKINERISARRERLRSLMDKPVTCEVHILNSELGTLTREYSETLRTAAYLKNYYKPESRIAWGGTI